jgi:hypothetical protein
MNPNFLEDAKALGLLAPDCQLPEPAGRPWPVVLFSALGAWLAALPLLGVVVLFLYQTVGSALEDGPALYIAGAVLLAAAIRMLRTHGIGLFWEQLALPVLSVGLSCIGWVVFRDMEHHLAPLAIGLLTLGIAWFIPAHWLRCLLAVGTTAALLVSFNAAPEAHYWSSRYQWPWTLNSLYLTLAAWVCILALQARSAGRVAGYLESLITGSSVVLLVSSALIAGPAFLVGGAGALAEIGGLFGNHGAQRGMLERGLSVVATAAGLAVLTYRWPLTRARALPWGAGVALALLVLAAYASALGGILLATALLATSARWTLAIAGAAAAVWAIGSFYYQLGWPLDRKAFLLAGLGLLLALMAALAGTARRRMPVAAPSGRPASKMVLTLVGATLLATLSVANIGIWQKEQTIRHGQPVFVKLAPVDPRSLMQGDYMRLNFDLPSELRWGDGPPTAQRPTVLLRPHPGLPGAYDVIGNDAAVAGGTTAAGIEVQLARKNGQWVLVSDAWYFKEGQASRFAAARYGEFRVLPSGTAVLVGLADEKLQPIR